MFFILTLALNALFKDTSNSCKYEVNSPKIIAIFVFFSQKQCFIISVLWVVNESRTRSECGFKPKLTHWDHIFSIY